MCEAIGVDSYNLCTTGNLAITVKASRADPEHQPCVLIVRNNENELGWQTDSSDIDSEQCKRSAEDAG